MRKSLTARVFSGCLAASLFSIATLSFPFAVFADQQAGFANPSGEQFSCLVSLTDGDKPAQTLVASGRTVAEALTQAGIKVEAADKVSPPLTASLTAGTAIAITRVQVKTETQAISLPYKTVFKMSSDVAPGRIQPGHEGVPGLLTKTIQTTYVNGHVADQQVANSLERAPQDSETLAGIRLRGARALPSRGGAYQRLRCLSMTATGYSPYEGSSTGRCATGMRAGYGVVAVDPHVIRLGTKLYVEGYGYAVAGDTGGAIKGRRIDLGHTTYREAADVGRRHVRVWVLAAGR